jgi:hypothetical protein
VVIVSFWWESRDNIGGFELTSSTMSRLTAISNFIGFTVIGTCDEEEVEAEDGLPD